jgi:hypothetical protein
MAAASRLPAAMPIRIVPAWSMPSANMKVTEAIWIAI